jgi:hypothetical protein
MFCATLSFDFAVDNQQRQVIVQESEVANDSWEIRNDRWLLSGISTLSTGTLAGQAGATDIVTKVGRDGKRPQTLWRALISDDFRAERKQQEFAWKFSTTASWPATRNSKAMPRSCA